MRTLLIPFLFAALTTQAQVPLASFADALKIYPSRTDPSGWFLLNDENYVRKYDHTAMGYADALQEFERLTRIVDRAWGPHVILIDRVYMPSYVTDMNDYILMNVAAVTGSGWYQKSNLWGSRIIGISLDKDMYLIWIR
jgi:hypothetical protein